MHSAESVGSVTLHPQPLFSTRTPPECADHHLRGPFAITQYRQLLTGMLARGHGIEALCAFLTLTRDVLLDLLVQFDLPTPHDRPLRRTGGLHAWVPSDYSTLLTGWLENWPTACIAQEIKRSQASIWAKTRRMGLPRRDRRSLSWPTGLPVVPVSPVVKVLPEPAKPDTPKRLPAKWLVRGTDEPLELTSKRNGLEVDWAGNTKALIELGMRCWGGQLISKVAEDFGVSYRAVTSQLHWLQVKSPTRAELTESFDRAAAEENIKKAGYKLMFCKSDTRFPYWADRIARTRSKRDVKVGFYDVGFA